MFLNDWKKDILNIPNLLSLLRLIMVPFYSIIYLNAKISFHYITAGIILLVSCLTDTIDGKIARKYNMETSLGRVLDPFADKITQFVLIICTSTRYSVLQYVLFIFLVKECFQICVGLLNLSKGKILPGAIPAGKICTAVLFISMIILVINPNISNAAVNVIAYTDVLFLIISFAGYFVAYYGPNEKILDIES